MVNVPAALHSLTSLKSGLKTKAQISRKYLPLYCNRLDFSG
jgi:hypothetical protein